MTSTSTTDPLRAPTPRELAAEYQREVEAAYDSNNKLCPLHQPFWGREIKTQFRKIYEWGSS